MSTGRAEKIAARTVNKNRAQSGEYRQGPGGPTKDQLYNEARQRNIHGRSTMSKQELKNALGK